MKTSKPLVAICIGLVALLGISGLAGCARWGGGAQTSSSPEPTKNYQPVEGFATATANLAPDPAVTIPIPTPSPTPQPPFVPLAVQAPDCSYGGEFKAIEAIDAETVQFSLCSPDPAFLAKLAFPAFGIQPREWLEQTGGGGAGSTLLEKPVGTGPYQVSEWKHGEELVFKAFENYWGAEKAKTPALVFHWNLDSGQRLLELQAGTANGMDAVNPADFDVVSADPSLALLYRAPLNVLYLGMNNTQSPFDNEKVRQAIAIGIDRQKIVTEDFPVGYEIASHFAPCSLPNGCSGEDWYTFDLAKAKALLSEAGFPDGFVTELTYQQAVRGYLPRPDVVAKEIRSQLLENLQIDARIRTMEPDAFNQAVDTGSVQGLYLLGWGADYPDVSNFLDFHFGERASQQFGNKFEDILQALRSADAQPDDARRQPFYLAANNAIRQHVPMVPIVHGGWAVPDDLAVVYQKTVQGAQASPLDLESFSGISLPGQAQFVWIQAAEPASLYCADETDVDSLRACSQVTEGLYHYAANSAAIQPALAEACQPNEDLTVWTCRLRKGVQFQNGSMLDANDVLASFAVQWDAGNPLHKGDKGGFLYFKQFWGNFLNAPGP